MGLLLFPVIFIAFIIWAFCLFFLLIRISQRKMKSYFPLLAAPALSAIIYLSILTAWSTKTEIWVMESIFTIPIFMIILPGIFAVFLVYSAPQQKVVNFISFTLCISTIFSGLIMVIFPQLMEADFFLNIKLTH